MQSYQQIGVVTHFFDKLCVAVVQLQETLYLEDWVLIHGPRTNLEQQVISMQIHHQCIDKGEPGEQIALRVSEPVREGDAVYLILDETQILN
jgi:hypothetical protein